jgi:hypothetical protein
MISTKPCTTSVTTNTLLSLVAVILVLISSSLSPLLPTKQQSPRDLQAAIHRRDGKGRSRRVKRFGADDETPEQLSANEQQAERSQIDECASQVVQSSATPLPMKQNTSEDKQSPKDPGGGGGRGVKRPWTDEELSQSTTQGIPSNHAVIPPGSQVQAVLVYQVLTFHQH